MATFYKSKCQDGDKVSKSYEWRCQGIKTHFQKPKHMKEHI